MKPLLLIAFVFFSSCAIQQYELDYIRSIDEIKEVVLVRPDKNSSGKFAETKALSRDEIKQLLNALDKAQAIGPTKFIPDYYIEFEQISSGNKRLKVNGTTIKGYDSDYSFKIEKLNFLENF